jgi:hypothetical protein
VQQAELEEIHTRRKTVRYDDDDDPRTTLVGLALSGGGIRSATFSLGVLQGLHDCGFLRLVDYISSVSGGGFVTGWWSAWLNRPKHAPGSLFPASERIEPARRSAYELRTPDSAVDAGIDPVHHLRLFSNYLTPRKGLLSTDTWLAAAAVSRNLLLTWLVLLPLLGIVVLLGQTYFILQPFDDRAVSDFVSTNHSSPLFLAVAARPLLALALLLIWVTIVWMRHNNAAGSLVRLLNLLAVLSILVLLGAAFVPWSIITDASPSIHGRWGRLCSTTLNWVPLNNSLVVGCSAHRGDVWLALFTLVCGLAIHASIEQRVSDSSTPQPRWWRRVLRTPTPPTSPTIAQTRANRATHWHARLLTVFVFTLIVLLFASLAPYAVATAADDIRSRRFGVLSTLSALVAFLSVTGTLYTAFKATPTAGRDAREVAQPSVLTRVAFAVTPGLVLVVLASLAAWTTHLLYASLVSINCLRSAAGVGLILSLVFAFWENFATTDESARGPWAYPSAALVLLILGLGSSTAPYLQKWLPLPADTNGAIRITLGLLIITTLCELSSRSARVRFLLFFLCGTIVVHALATSCWFTWPVWRDGHLNTDVRQAPLELAILALATLAGWVIALGWTADPNALSLHTFYKARLVRAYLGASNTDRGQLNRDITQPDPADDLRLADLDSCRQGGAYPLINTTLNLVGGHDLATAQRSAAHFLLSPRYCGSERTRYRETRLYMDGAMTLGAAVATSGAAVSPNMGAMTQSATLALFLAFLNIRLGLWVPTPDRAAWAVPQTRLWPAFLLRESLSQTTDVSSSCYLTDGGHFDNTGLYPLLARACRLIVLCDSGADPDRTFEDLGTAIRRSRIDFGVDIELDINAFRPPHPQQPNTHVVIGTIHYTDAHLASLAWSQASLATRDGKLIWIKPTILATDTVPDVRQYGLEHPLFPQQSTLNQWFDESQFESYRKLGEMSANEACAALSSQAALPQVLNATAIAQFIAGLLAPSKPSAPSTQE